MTEPTRANARDEQRWPYRLVGAAGSWHATNAPDGHPDPVVYQRDGGPYDGSALTLAEVTAADGPVRPVRPADPADLELLRVALVNAGVRAVGSTAAALYLVHRDGHRLTAGRPGSWESATLDTWRSFGAGLAVDRVHPHTAADLRVVLLRWVASPGQYVEVAETLAHVFGKVVDERGGWAKVADLGVRNLGYADQLRNLCCYTSSKHGAASWR